MVDPNYNPLVAKADTLVVFVDGAGVEYVCATPRLGHTDREVRAVAYRWACARVANGDWHPHAELRFARLRSRP